MATLNAAFAPEVLRVTDDSARHAGHVGIRGNASQGEMGQGDFGQGDFRQGEIAQTHFSILLVSAAFLGMTRVARSRAVHAALAGEFGAVEAGGMHALALTLRTPEEHRTLTQS